MTGSDAVYFAGGRSFPSPSLSTGVRWELVSVAVTPVADLEGAPHFAILYTFKRPKG